MINLIPPDALKGVKREYYVRVGTVWAFLLTGAFVALILLLIPLYVLINSQLNAMILEGGEFIETDTKFAEAEIKVKCSKGTYIRSLAYDLGREIGCGAMLNGLVRTKIGPYFVENSINLDDFSAIYNEKMS